jgi:hypothetical protein
MEPIGLRNTVRQARSFAVGRAALTCLMAISRYRPVVRHFRQIDQPPAKVEEAGFRALLWSLHPTCPDDSRRRTIIDSS